MLASILFFTACGGGSSSSTRTDPIAIDGTFVGKDSANRDTTVILNSTNNTINISIANATTPFVLDGTIILSSVASTGKKMATGDISYHIDLKITNSTLEGFLADEISYGTIIKEMGSDSKWQYTCAFNFTSNTLRGTNTTDSDWSMTGQTSE